MGKQLDSLADVVSFGVAPGMILLQFLRLAYASQENGLNISVIWLLPAFLVPAAGAFRLARFNTDAEQSYSFKGVPIPAAGLLIASFPLIAFFDSNLVIPALQPLHTGFIHLLANKWFLYFVIVIVSWLMVSTLPMMALKFTSLLAKSNWPKFLLIAIALVAGIFLQWLAVPVIFIVYVVLSLLFKPKTS
jgi:CDP-diacylglycerol--serine O-phosphatidyltransferase